MPDVPRGLLTPFQRDQRRDFASGTGPALLESKVVQVLATEGQTPRSSGELPWRTAFGAGFHLLRHQRNDDALAGLAHVYARDPLRRWLPEAALLEVSVTRQDAGLFLSIRYKEASLGVASAPERTSLTVDLSF